MGKRKRDSESPSSTDTSDDRKRAKLRIAINNGIKHVTSALEQARRFERQKLGKRQHDKRNDVDGRRINVEIAVLKSLDMGTIAKQKVHKNLVKTTSIAKTGLLPEDVVLPSTGALDKTTADLMARLFKQKGVTEAMDGTMTGVRQVLGLQANGTGKKAKLRDSAERSNGVKTTAKDTEHSNRAMDEPRPKKPTSKTVVDISDSEEEFRGFSSRVASSSDEEDVDEESDESKEESDNDLRVPRLRNPRVASMSISGSDSEPHPYEELNLKPRPKNSARPPPTSSAFLPSLSMGGYMSNSDSDATDVEDHIAPRKNRRGQRARQTIWEKKFKEQAKHLKDPPKSNSKKDKRGEGWDAQRGAVSKDDRRGRFGKRGPSGGNTAPLGKDRGEKKAEAKSKHRDDGGALHPSWEAKKNAKQQTAGIGGFKGKKMTFD